MYTLMKTFTQATQCSTKHTGVRTGAGGLPGETHCPLQLTMEHTLNTALKTEKCIRDLDVRQYICLFVL
jgi:hypothetical protein